MFCPDRIYNVDIVVMHVNRGYDIDVVMVHVNRGYDIGIVVMDILLNINRVAPRRMVSMGMDDATGSKHQCKGRNKYMSG